VHGWFPSKSPQVEATKMKKAKSSIFSSIRPSKRKSKAAAKKAAAANQEQLQLQNVQYPPAAPHGKAAASWGTIAAGRFQRENIQTLR
jgi:hypothetical protein